MKYRPDIDGLRAVAVLAVVAAHVGAYRMLGGFLGVDVFFVISGYLITGFVFAEIEQGAFTLRVFYGRRLRRIVPAFAVVLLAASILATCYLLPTEMTDFAKSLAAAISGASNFYFWGKAGYFDAPSIYRPLLHTWSLAIEEQFYLFWPPLLGIAFRTSSSAVRTVTIALFFLSFGASVITDVIAPDARFYLLASRAWELLAGAVLSLNILPEITGTFGRNVAGAGGLAVIVASFFAIDSHKSCLALLTVIPCLGAAAVIAAGETGPNFVGRCLSARPVVFIGLISYSLYLWHWPLIVFHRMGLFDSLLLPPPVEKAVLIGASIALASLSWRYVERPFRSKKIPAEFIFRASGATFVAFLVWTGIVGATAGLSNRYAPDVVKMSSFLDYDSGEMTRLGRCFITGAERSADFDTGGCLKGQGGRKAYLLWGDSHAAHLWYGLAQVFSDKDMLQATSAGCKPWPVPRPGSDDACNALTGLVVDRLRLQTVDTVLLEAAWDERDLAGLPDLLDWASTQARHVVLFGPMIRYDAPLPRIVALSMIKHDPFYVAAHRSRGLAELDKAMAAVAVQHHVRYVSFFDLLCNGASCETSTPSGVPMLFDYGHLTKDGSLHVAQYLHGGQGL